MNRFYRVATDVLVAHDAIIDKLMGDEVMALFVPGISGPEYRRKAVEAALDLLEVIGYGDGDGDEPWLRLGVGVHAGTAFVGNVGGAVIDFTALGDTVNTAARLQSAAAPGEVVVSDEIWPDAGRDGCAERRQVVIRGKSDPVGVRVLRR
jgi:adenylate cyclase